MVNYNNWIGRQEISNDVIEQGLTRRIAATFGVSAPKNGDILPYLWHWAYFLNPENGSQLSEDGHPERGDFLPPADNQNRMWAGGDFSFFNPLIVGKPAKRISTIKSITEKQGRSGALLFVTIQHDYIQDGISAIIEQQNIVYREPSKPKLVTTENCPQSDWQEECTPDPVLLFRYSAVTFNSHRIHYDVPYVTGKEGYPDLVVQGQLIATLTLNAFIKANPHANIMSYSYRSQRPLILPDRYQVAGRCVDEGKAKIWAGNENGLAQIGEVEFILMNEK